MKTTDNLYQEVKTELEKVWGKDKHMIDYCLKEISNAFAIEEGIVTFEKPRIKKTFCFSYGQNGMSDNEDSERASAMAVYASRNQDYFLEKNLSYFTSTLDMLKDSRYTCCISKHYSEGCLYTMFVAEPYYQRPPQSHRIATAKERELFTVKLQEEKEKFTKRLNTYLKKYGLSKIETWSYLSD